MLCQNSELEVEAIMRSTVVSLLMIFFSVLAYLNKLAPSHEKSALDSVVTAVVLGDFGSSSNGG